MLKSKSLLIISSIAFCSLIVVLASEYHIFQKDILSKAASTSSTAAVAGSSYSPSDPASAPKTYEFKLATNADECLLNKLGADGWQPIQYGTPTIVNAQTGCSKRGNVAMWIVYDWILMQRDGVSK